MGEDGDSEEDGRASAPAPLFDVSDVNFVDIPEVDCSNNTVVDSWHSCLLWQESSSPFVGYYPGIIKPDDPPITHRYYQMKIPSEDVEEWEATIYERNPGIKQHGCEITVVPVPHDYEELWTSAVVLDRFVLSKGNTVGILDAYVGLNKTHWDPYGIALPINREVGLLNRYANSRTGPNDWSKARDTVLLTAHDAQGVADALPDLLPLLGIPVDAVGVIYQIKPWRDIPRVGGSYSSDNSYNFTIGDWGLGIPSAVKLRRSEQPQAETTEADEVIVDVVEIAEAEDGLDGEDQQSGTPNTSLTTENGDDQPTATPTIVTFDSMASEESATQTVDNTETGQTDSVSTDQLRAPAREATKHGSGEGSQQTDSEDTNDLSSPAVGMGKSDDEESSVRSSWVPTVIVAGMVALVLVSVGLVGARLRHRSS